MSNKDAKKQEHLFELILLMSLAFIVHIVCSVMYEGFAADIACFNAWADEVFSLGPAGFYRPNSFSDYPPGYMYVLWVIGAIKHVFGITSGGTASIVLIKMPAMLCDLGIGYIIYRIAKKYVKYETALLFAALYMFNPAVIINSSTWGQVDSVFTLFVLLTCYLVTEKKLTPAYYVFAIGILIKPQTLIFTPIIIYGIIDQVFLKDYSSKRMLKELGMGVLAILSMVILAAPFGIDKVFTQYVDTMGSYPHASVNAYNLWAMLGKNWYGQDDIFIFLSFKQWGYLFIVLIVLVSAIYCLKNKEEESKYYITGAFIVFGMFTLSARMHDRYMYPAMALFLAGMIVKRKKEFYITYGLISLVHFLNVYHVLFYYDAATYDFGNKLIPTFSAMTVAAFAYFCYVMFRFWHVPRELTYDEAIAQSRQNVKGAGKNNEGNNRNNSYSKNNKSIEISDSKVGFDILPSFKSSKWIKADFIAIGIITIVYAIIAFARLGDMDAPQTAWNGKTGDEIVLDFGEVKDFSSMFCYLGSYENREFNVDTSQDGSEWTRFTVANEEGKETVNMCSVFCWNKQDFACSARYIKMSLVSDIGTVMEFMFYDAAGNAVVPVNSADYPELFDEQDIFDGTYSFMNSTYFDEIYHARTAYEMIHRLYNYECTHPPLGKAIMAIGILIFGMCPFGWRFMGTLFGVLMLPIMYLMARKLTDKTWMATLFTLLFAFDFMHFTQTRIATIDVFVTLFIMLEYFFMLCYYRMSFYDTPLKKTFIPLLLSGTFMGLGCGAKWTGVYAGMGLAVVFFAVIFRRYMEYRRAVSEPKGKSEGIEHSYIIENFKLYSIKTLCFCLIAFIVVPVIMYILSYIPYYDATDRSLIESLLANQTYMYDYHSNLDATHPYSSLWYEWPTIVRPMLYYCEQLGNNVSAGISAMGNPFIWWAGMPAFIFLVYRIFKNRDRMAFFLCVGYMAQYLPWVMVSRCIFIYHYFPSVPFVILMVGYSIYTLVKAKPKLKYAAVVYVLLCAALFVAFYPVISGYPISLDYGKYLKWFSDWVLIY